MVEFYLLYDSIWLVFFHNIAENIANSTCEHIDKWRSRSHMIRVLCVCVEPWNKNSPILSTFNYGIIFVVIFFFIGSLSLSLLLAIRHAFSFFVCVSLMSPLLDIFFCLLSGVMSLQPHFKKETKRASVERFTGNCGPCLVTRLINDLGSRKHLITWDTTLHSTNARTRSHDRRI